MKPCEDKWHCKSRSKEERILPIQSKRSGKVGSLLLEMGTECVASLKVRNVLNSPNYVWKRY